MAISANVKTPLLASLTCALSTVPDDQIDGLAARLNGLDMDKAWSALEGARGVRAERCQRMRAERGADTAPGVPAARCVSFLEDIPAPIFAAWREMECTTDDVGRITGEAEHVVEMPWRARA